MGDVIEVALALRKLLELLELPSVPKTSGQRGLHILVPIAQGHTAAQTHELATAWRCSSRASIPTTSRSRRRAKRAAAASISITCRTSSARRSCVPYSLRAADGAPVSTPLEWDEVTRSLDPKTFTLRTVRARLDALGDLAAPLHDGRTKLAGAIARLKQ